MESTDQQLQLKQAQTSFWAILAMTLFAFSVFIRSLDGNQLWKIVCSTIGLTIFLILIISLFVRMMRLRNAAR